MTSPSSVNSQTPASKLKIPDTLVIIFFVALLAAIATHFIPVGTFQTETVTYLSDGVEKTKSVVDPESFQYVLDEQGEQTYSPVSFFEGGGNVGLLNFAFEGLTSGSKWGGAIGVIMFMLVIGGSFGIVMATGTIDNGIKRLITRTNGKDWLFIPVIFFTFSLGGAVFGMGEEAIAFAMIIYPLMVRLGYDGIVTVMTTYVATQIGFGTSWMNPFSVAIAQGIAGVPVLSGSNFRIAMWFGFTILGMAFTMWYAQRIRKEPTLSYSYHSDQQMRQSKEVNDDVASRFNLGDWLVMLTITGTMIWVVWGVVAHAWYIPEIASQFFTMGVVVGLIGVVFKLNGLTLSQMAKEFKTGAAGMVEPAMLVGCASGIMLLLGGSKPTDGTVLNTILNSAGETISYLPPVISAWGMFAFQSTFNFFVTSGSGQAALTMPLMAPLADLVGVTRQVAVLAFQLGDGFTNILVPTSAPLMATLGVCRIDWGDWLRFIWKFMVLLFVVASVLVIGAHLSGFA